MNLIKTEPKKERTKQAKEKAWKRALKAWVQNYFNSEIKEKDESKLVPTVFAILKEKYIAVLDKNEESEKGIHAIAGIIIYLILKKKKTQKVIHESNLWASQKSLMLEHFETFISSINKDLNSNLIAGHPIFAIGKDLIRNIDGMYEKFRTILISKMKYTKLTEDEDFEQTVKVLNEI